MYLDRERAAFTSFVPERPLSAGYRNEYGSLVTRKIGLGEEAAMAASTRQDDG
jgi:hypothetical protein